MSGEHDENIPFDQMVERVGGNHAEELRRLSLIELADDHQRGVSQGPSAEYLQDRT